MLDSIRLCAVMGIAGFLGCASSSERDRRAGSQDTARTQQQTVQETTDNGQESSTPDELRNVQLDSQDTSDQAIPVHFKPAAGESTLVVHAIKMVMQRNNGPQMRRGEIRGQLFRMDPTPGKRYMLFAAQPRFRAPDGEHWGRSFYVLDLSGGVVALSPPLDMKDAEYITLEALRDVDGDGTIDLIYCKGYEGEEDLPRHLAATYRGLQWATIPDSLVAQGDCKGKAY
jgi:hypothetical protein